MTTQEKQKAYAKAYYLRNRDKALAQAKKWGQENAVRKREIGRKSKLKTGYKPPIESARKWHKKYLEAHPRAVKDWVQKNKSRHLATKRVWHHANKSNPAYIIPRALRRRIWNVIKGGKSASTLQLLGCSRESFIVYLESKFEPGMTWGNYGEWHIDHIMPCAIFDLTKSEHQRRCFHFSNMQPLWASENLAKRDQVPPSHQFNLI